MFGPSDDENDNDDEEIFCHVSGSKEDFIFEEGTEKWEVPISDVGAYSKQKFSELNRNYSSLCSEFFDPVLRKARKATNLPWADVFVAKARVRE